MKLSATHAVNCIVLMVKFRTSCESIPPALIMQKADLPETKDNGTITRKVRADGNKLCPGKHGAMQFPSSLGARSITVASLAVSE